MIAGEPCATPLKVGRKILLTPTDVRKRFPRNDSIWTCPTCGYISTIPNFDNLNAELPKGNEVEQIERRAKLLVKQNQEINRVMKNLNKKLKLKKVQDNCKCKKKCKVCKCAQDELEMLEEQELQERLEQELQERLEELDNFEKSAKKSKIVIGTGLKRGELNTVSFKKSKR